MKKIVAYIAFFCYMSVSTGVIINYHYCMNRLASTQLFSSGKDVCGQCGMHNDDSNGCCHDEVKVVKLELDHTTVPVITFDFPAYDAAIIPPSEFIETAFYNINVEKHFHNHSPPLLSGQDTYIRNNVFRI